MMERNFIDDEAVKSFLFAHPGATAMEIQDHIGATINGIRTKLRKMVVAGVVDCKRVDGRNTYKLHEHHSMFGSPNQAWLNSLLGRTQQRRASL